jgi:hypothetical protein
MQTIEATIERVVRRQRNTVNGNPRLIVEVLTSADGPSRREMRVRGDSFLSLSINGGMYVGDGIPRTFEVIRGSLASIVE